jgi:hypothetical protein
MENRFCVRCDVCLLFLLAKHLVFGVLYLHIYVKFHFLLATADRFLMSCAEYNVARWLKMHETSLEIGL